MITLTHNIYFYTNKNFERKFLKNEKIFWQNKYAALRREYLNNNNYKI